MTDSSSLKANSRSKWGGRSTKQFVLILLEIRKACRTIGQRRSWAFINGEIGG